MFQPAETAEAVGGRILNLPAFEENRKVELGPLQFDTRQLSAGEIFVALPGEQRDGHDFLLDAMRSGAALRQPGGVLRRAGVDPGGRALHHVARGGGVGVRRRASPSGAALTRQPTQRPAVSPPFQLLQQTEGRRVQRSGS